MCTTVRFVYSCGCTENTIFECPGTTRNGNRRRRCSGPGEVMSTVLDEECHDCSRKRFAATLMGRFAMFRAELPNILGERDPNLPTNRSPTPASEDSDTETDTNTDTDTGLQDQQQNRE
ncbi:hypothetical protein F4677DRAFT_232642 [Hypoxylon crocopeplum]|nr:hypothetical protein F4677DRAFT_232642 [Hypoxylon crocopeplum]